MKKILLILSFFLLASCGTPAALKFIQISPINNEKVITVKELFEQADPETKAKMPPNAEDIVIIGNENIIITLALYELKDIYWLEVYVYNANNEPFIINASDFVLMNSYRTGLRMLSPHEAANIYLAKCKGIPPYQYQPKYIYSAQSATSGYIYSSGYIAAQTQTSGTIYEDPWRKAGYDLGYAIAAGIVANENKKFINMAGAIYTLGLVEKSSVPGKTGAYGGLYWLKPERCPIPLILRIIPFDYEISFKPRPYVPQK